MSRRLVEPSQAVVVDDGRHSGDLQGVLQLVRDRRDRDTPGQSDFVGFVEANLDLGVAASGGRGDSGSNAVDLSSNA